jgi:hypothetical protein
MATVGTRAQVMHGTAIKTSGGLTSKDLKYNKSGNIVSKRVSALAKQQQKLKKAGYTTVKGQFGAVKIGSKHMKGGDKEYLLTILKDETEKPVKITLTSTKFMNSNITGNGRTTFIYKDNISSGYFKKTSDIEKRIKNIENFFKEKNIIVKLERIDETHNLNRQKIDHMLNFKINFYISNNNYNKL